MDSQPENLQGAAIASPQEEFMEKPADDAPEHIKCRWWRNDLMELTREQLAAATGFSVSTIRDFESGKEVDPMARKRYTLACAAVSAGVEFTWTRTSYVIRRTIRFTEE
ncbi:helix-turn-helix transcriptional regulator [Agrobacterium rhizogenes]|nr:helix-turn-helix transcriptional regulator [Rhizobium rhizogenes]NTH97028.1 helix-turn-helix transcriptional regulator [Rhizobium rhizogenes]NTJ15214.1 helix-turn-helix transcriptional regulator [Rhizobium rhizogenes]